MITNAEARAIESLLVLCLCLGLGYHLGGWFGSGIAAACFILGSYCTALYIAAQQDS
jgi:chromate transport protein ChrA